MINQGVQSLLQAPEIDWVLQQRLCLLNYWQLSFFFFFFLCEFLSSSECQCVCCCFSPGHTWKWGAADLVPRTAPCSSRSRSCSQEGTKGKGWKKKKQLQLREMPAACSFQSRIRPFSTRKISLEVWRFFSALVCGVFTARGAGHPAVSQVACTQSHGLLLTPFTQPAGAVTWDPGETEEPKCHIAVNFLLMLLIYLCHTTCCCTSSPQPY